MLRPWRRHSDHLWRRCPHKFFLRTGQGFRTQCCPNSSSRPTPGSHRYTPGRQLAQGPPAAIGDLSFRNKCVRDRLGHHRQPTSAILATAVFSTGHLVGCMPCANNHPAERNRRCECSLGSVADGLARICGSRARRHALRTCAASKMNTTPGDQTDYRAGSALQNGAGPREGEFNRNPRRLSAKPCVMNP